MNSDLFTNIGHILPAAKSDFIHLLREQLKGDNLKAQLKRGGLASGLILALNRVLTLVLGIVLARSLGAEGYGVYAYAFAIMSLLIVLAEAGVPTLLMREVAASQGREQWELMRGAMIRGGQLVVVASILVSFLGFVLLWILSDSLSRDVTYTAAFMLLVLPLASMARAVAAAMRGLHRVVLGQSIDILLRPVIVLLILVVVFSLWPALRAPQVAMAAQFSAGLVVLLVGLYALRRSLPPQYREATTEYDSRRWLKSALPFMLIGGAGIINSQIDIIMLGWFREAGEVGIYRVAVQGAALIAFSLEAVNSVIAPHFARLFAQDDKTSLQRLVTSSARAMLITALPLALAMIFAGGAIAGWVFGDEFSQSRIPLAVLAVGQLITVGFGSVAFLLNMSGHENDTLRILLWTAALNIVLNAALIPSHGMTGAAIASAISLALWNVLLFQLVRSRLNVNSTAFYLGPSK